ncbi:hypothetical protein [Pseudovibrio sp. Tun.PSC04-5.I4]|uniref:hypothetical protein n=1 Tax=Pseudovibrio sp. Tun.PSC04-5.I4 TaxID=1798213 RepID=UPI000885DF94|nr:hypothetical protein [Pseudovibrio sp. Tun.PSC04-5.I4]SDQ81681.1 hypothetical protein SAMN04515695_1512 [Pseudovibrio sp. Tun.PSC04-5.I4]
MIKDDVIAGEFTEEIDASDADIRRLALSFIQEAWEDGLSHGIDSTALAHAALFSAMMDLVSLYGEEAVSKFAEEIPQRVERGDYSLERRLH